MKKVFLLFVISISLLYNCQNGYSDQNKNFNIEKHAALCRVWGVLKYYHPGASNNNIDWDNEVLKILQSYNKIKNKIDLNMVINVLIEICNKYDNAPLDSSTLEGEFYKMRSFSWLSDTTYISLKNTIVLKRIIKDHQPFHNQYVSQDTDVGNLYFNNEKNYADSVFPSKYLQLLSLFRYWNIINYFYPYHELNDICWDSVLYQNIPRFMKISDTLGYHLKVLELTSQLNDGHVWTESAPINYHFGIYSPPYKLKYIENRPIIDRFFPDSLGRLQNLKIGDQLVGINGIPIQEIINRKSKYYSFSNYDQFYRRIMEGLLRTPTRDSINITVIRNGGTITESVKPILMYELYQIQDREDKSKPPFKIINDSIAYINLKYLYVDRIDSMMQIIHNLPKIIIDIRNYPNNVLYELSKYFNSSTIDFAKVFIPNIKKPGQFIWSTTISTGQQYSLYYKGRVFLLVNEETQSHAEFTAMCLQTAPNVKTIGSHTAGTDGNVSYVSLPGGLITYFTSIGITYPNEIITQRVGVSIDTLIKPKIIDYINNYDRILDLAIQL